MLKKSLLIVLLSALFFVSSATSIKAEPASLIDQACLSERSDYFNINLRDGVAAQMFTPTKDTLDSALLELHTYGGGQAKARVRIWRFMMDPQPKIIAEKYIWVPEESNSLISIDFTDVPMPVGNYMLVVESLSQDHPVYWVSTDGDCYRGGFAFIDGHERRDLDMVFGIEGYNSVSAQENTNSAQPPAAAESIAPAPPASSTPAQTSTPTEENSNTGAVNESSNVVPIDSNSVVKGPIPGDTSEMNKESIYKEKLASSEELQEAIAFIMNDIEKNRYKGGAFGLSGAVGRALTWPVFYGICGLALLLIIIVIIRSVKRKRGLDTKAVVERKPATDQTAKGFHDSVSDKMSANLDVSNAKTKESVVQPKKKKKIGWVILVLILLFFGANMGYRLYLASTHEEDDKKVATISEQPVAPEETSKTSTTSTSKDNKTTTGSSTTSESSSSSTVPATSPTSQSAASEKEKMIEYFIDIAVPSPITIERWVKNPFNVGFGPDTLDPREETCVDGFIRDFNNASNTIKLAKDRVDADLKIYKVTPEQMAQYGGEDAGRGVAFGYKNSSNERYKGEIFISTAVPNDDNAKCYLMRHEMMHSVGFHGHSDLFWEGIMAVPGVGRNSDNIMSEVDTIAIKMLYNTGLPLKSNEADTRAYLNAHYPN